jgi:hypothetical protein
MTDSRTITRALAGSEDLLLGVGSVDQSRNGSTIPITKINANNIPYEGNTEGVDLIQTKAVIQAPIKRGVYDFATDGGSIGDFVLGYIPDNSTIIKAWYEIITEFTSAGLATVAVGVDTDDSAGIVAATAFDNAVFDAGYHDTLATGVSASYTTKSTAIRNVNMSVATADLTAGKMYVWFQYITSE